MFGGFYVVGGTLRSDAPSYVLRQADVWLFDSLKRKQFCYVLTARQMGKSSLMVRTAARLREENFSVAVLDLTSLGQNLTADQWYNGLLERAARQFDLDDELDQFWAQNQNIGPLQRWVRAMESVVLPIQRGRSTIIFIDEIDAVRSLAFSTDEFFAGIRELHNRRAHDPKLEQLTFCLMGVASPSDLIRDTRTTPFNIGRRIELTDFTESEAAPLVKGLGKEPAAGPALLKRVLYWTGGHPFLTQRLCRALSEDREASRSSDVDRICRDLFLSNRARESDDNLLFVRERVLHSEGDLAGLLGLYEKILSGNKVHARENDPANEILRLSGLVKVEKGLLKVRNRVYATVFDRNWVFSSIPGAEVRRQRIAYRKGVLVATLALAPLIFVALYALYGFVKNSRAVIRSTAPSPPAFWASFSTRSSADPNNGTVLIKASEDGVAIFINRVQYGYTANQGVLRIERLPASVYEIQVAKPGFRTISQQTEVRARVTTPLVLELERGVQPIQALTQIQEAPEGAQVSVDGVNIGTISSAGFLAFQVHPGEHTIGIAKDSWAWETNEQFAEGVIERLNFSAFKERSKKIKQENTITTTIAELLSFKSRASNSNNESSSTNLPIFSGQIAELEVQQRSALVAAGEMVAANDLTGARAQLQNAANLNGPLTEELKKRISEIDMSKNDPQLRQLRQTEESLWQDALKSTNNNRFMAAQRDLRQILELGHGGLHREDAQTYLDKVIPPHLQELDLLTQARLDLAQGSFKSARAIVDQLSKNGSDPSKLVAEIDAKERTQILQLEKKYNELSQRDGENVILQLNTLWLRFNELAVAGGPMGGEALDYVNKIPETVIDMEARLSPKGTDALFDLTLQGFQRAVKRGDTEGFLAARINFQSIVRAGGPHASEAQQYEDDVNRMLAGGRSEDNAGNSPRVAAVRAAMQLYVDAFERRNVDALRQIWPDMGAQYEGFKLFFADAKSIVMRMEIENMKFDPDGENVIVSGKLHREYTGPDSRMLQLNERETFQLSKLNGLWVITAVDATF
jgi:hypothetical protein